MNRDTAKIILAILVVLFLFFCMITYISLNRLTNAVENSEATTETVTFMEGSDL